MEDRRGGDGIAARERRPVSVGRKLAYSALLLFVLLAVTEVVLHRLRWNKYGASVGSVFSQHDPDLGWGSIPDLTIENPYVPGAQVTHNAQGLRALEEYTKEVPEGRYRVLFVGDSFTHGYTGDAGTYPAILERLRPQLQCVNMGVGGHGVGQFYLHYRQREEELDADLVLFAVILDDFRRMGRTQTLWSRHPKPRVDLEGAALVARNVPVSDFAGVCRSVGDWLRHLPDSLALVRALADRKELDSYREYRWQPVARAIFAEVHGRVTARGGRFGVVYIPTGNALRPDSEVPGNVAWMAKVCQADGIPFFDLGPAFRRLTLAQVRGLLPNGNLGEHFNRTGNQVIARELLAQLEQRFEALPR